MRRWQAWHGRQSSQIAFWIAVAQVLGLLVWPRTEGPRWWSFERSDPRMVVAQSGGAPQSSWTAVARAVMPTVVNISSSRTVGGATRDPRPRTAWS